MEMFHFAKKRNEKSTPLSMFDGPWITDGVPIRFAKVRTDALYMLAGLGACVGVLTDDHTFLQ